MIIQLDSEPALDELREALDLIGVTFEVVPEEEPQIDPAWFKLPSPGSQRQAVLLHFFAVKQATREQAKDALGITSEGTTRIHELMQGGFLSETGERVLTEHGKTAAVVAPTEKARRELRLVPKAWFPGGVRPAGCGV